MNYIEQFRTTLLENSTALTYEDALGEWVYRGEQHDQPGFCICGHAIMDNRIVYNRLSGVALIIGNCCIKKFGIEREHWNRSRLDYLNYALGKANQPVARDFIQDLMAKLEMYPTLNMTERQKDWLEAIAGQPYRWQYRWERKRGRP